uniref:Uncharacterized protein n=1 Tax=Arundo donax TaxID=35708 RepID=A0A0A9DPX8_ARUDO
MSFSCFSSSRTIVKRSISSCIETNFDSCAASLTNISEDSPCNRTASSLAWFNELTSQLIWESSSPVKTECGMSTKLKISFTLWCSEKIISAIFFCSTNHPSLSVISKESRSSENVASDMTSSMR